MTTKETQDTNKNGTLELELDGKIWMVEKDKDGKVVSREELDGKLALEALLVVISDAIKYYSTEVDSSNKK